MLKYCALDCTVGGEIRTLMDGNMARLYWDLDGGFTPEAWLLPSWLPLPSFRYGVHSLV